LLAKAGILSHVTPSKLGHYVLKRPKMGQLILQANIRFERMLWRGGGGGASLCLQGSAITIQNHHLNILLPMLSAQIELLQGAFSASDVISSKILNLLTFSQLRARSKNYHNGIP
jgi:hypothetical protein